MAYHSIQEEQTTLDVRRFRWPVTWNPLLLVSWQWIRRQSQSRWVAQIVKLVIIVINWVTNIDWMIVQTSSRLIHHLYKSSKLYLLQFLNHGHLLISLVVQNRRFRDLILESSPSKISLLMRAEMWSSIIMMDAIFPVIWCLWSLYRLSKVSINHNLDMSTQI